MIKLVAAQEAKAQSFFLDLCIRTRIASNSRSESYCSSGGYGNPFLGESRAEICSKAAKTIINVITRRTLNFSDVDSALDTIKSWNFSFGNSPTSETRDWQIKNVAGAAKFLAWICAENEIYWNDMAYTAAEREAWKSSSSFAYYLFEAECFVSQPSTTKRIKTPSTATPGTAPASSYKAAGPQSAYVAGLVGKPGEKESVSASLLYSIVGAKAGTITPKAFIHPVENPAVGERAKVNAAGLPIVKFGAGNGYTDLAIFSTDPKVMEKILKGLEADGRSLTKYSGVHVAKTRNDASGYFRVNTEYGEVLVKPTKLNERIFAEVFEAMADSTTSELEESTGPVISDMKQWIRDSKLYD